MWTSPLQMACVSKPHPYLRVICGLLIKQFIVAGESKHHPSKILISGEVIAHYVWVITTDKPQKNNWHKHLQSKPSKKYHLKGQHVFCRKCWLSTCVLPKMLIGSRFVRTQHLRPLLYILSVHRSNTETVDMFVYYPWWTNPFWPLLLGYLVHVHSI